MYGCGVIVFVKQELDVPETDVVDERGRHYVIEQPPVLNLDLEGAEDEGLSRHEVTDHV